MYGIIFTQVVRHARDYFKTRALPKALTILGFVVVFAFVMAGLYFLLSRGLGFIHSSQFFGDAVSLYLYEMIMLVIVALSIATALIEGTFSLFRNANEKWILSSPGYDRVPMMVLYETISGGAFLPLLILAIPTLTAMETVYRFGVVGFVFSLISILLLVAVSVTATLVAEFVVAFVLKTLRMLSLTTLLTAMILLLAIAGTLTWHSVAHEGATLLFPDYAQSAPSKIDTVAAQFEFLPSHATALSLYAAENRNYAELFTLTIILAGAAALLYALYIFVARWYLVLWQDLQAEPQHARAKHPGPQVFPRIFSGALGALFEKDVLVIIRTGRDFMWLLFMLFLWLLQIGIDVLIRREMSGAAIGTFPLVIQALEVGVIAYFLGAFALRFSFPIFSVERGTAWIVNATPVSLVRMYASKLVFFVGFFGALSVIVALLHSYLLGLSMLSAAGLVVISLVSAVTITVFSILLGIAFPNFETTDPQALSTSLPGISLVFLVTIYGALGSYIFLQLLSDQNFIGIAWFVALSLGSILLSILISIRRLRHFEFG